MLKFAVYFATIIGFVISISVGVYALFHARVPTEDFYFYLLIIPGIPIALYTFLIAQAKKGSMGNFLIIICGGFIALIAANIYQDKTSGWWVFVMVPLLQIPVALVTSLLIALMNKVEKD